MNKQIFEKELNQIQEVNIKDFLMNAIKASPVSFKEDDELITYTRKVFAVTQNILDADKVEGMVRDLILASTLISDVGLNEDEKYRDIHPLLVRTILADVRHDLPEQLWEGLMRTVEAHEGRHTQIEALKPKPGSPEHIVALANVIVRSKGITVTLE